MIDRPEMTGANIAKRLVKDGLYPNIEPATLMLAEIGMLDEDKGKFKLIFSIISITEEKVDAVTSEKMLKTILPKGNEDACIKATALIEMIDENNALAEFLKKVISKILQHTDEHVIIFPTAQQVDNVLIGMHSSHPQVEIIDMRPDEQVGTAKDVSRLDPEIEKALIAYIRDEIY
jgi:hypothetical protein